MYLNLWHLERLLQFSLIMTAIWTSDSSQAPCLTYITDQKCISSRDVSAVFSDNKNTVWTLGTLADLKSHFQTLFSVLIFFVDISLWNSQSYLPSIYHAIISRGLYFFYPFFTTAAAYTTERQLFLDSFFPSEITTIYYWLLDHVIYLVLRKEERTARLSVQIQ